MAIRNGYLNFYCGGQSIAKVTFGRGLAAESHAKYLTDANVDGQIYLKLDAEAPQVAAQISRSHRYQGVEKLFVEAVCAASGSLIDLEMGLPSLPLPDARTGIVRLVAPRIDLVALEPIPGGWQVSFWEAKLPADSRMRTRGEEPEVIGQLNNYAEWFAQPMARAAVLAAYRDTCKLLVELHERAAALGIAVPPLHDAILAIAMDPSQLKAIDPKVRLLIDMREDDAHFRAVHLPKLKVSGVSVHLVRSAADMILPEGVAAA
ncbi:hypothetical protein AX761_24035 [Rhizobium sp. 58]|nr:hypothetical protein AX761_24035 [Rhizobium sp. 58]